VPALSPRISIVIPVYNEEAIMRSAIRDLAERLRTLDWNYELILAENGSTDGTLELARQLQSEYPELRTVTVSTPNYGLALRHGIERALGEFIICDEIDLGDTDFYQRALGELEQGRADLVVGSKLSKGARDDRPWFRHIASLAYNRLLTFLVGFAGTDTHGLKAMRAASMLPIIRSCRVDKDVFASEMVIRAYQAVRVVEIPTQVREKRPPSINLLRRIPNVVANLARLTWAIRASRCAPDNLDVSHDSTQ
jgi:glycosyltransferase involved in cell wall biosynthesis